MVHSFSASFWLEAERANLSVKLPKLNVMIDSQQLGHFNRLGVIKGCARLLIMVAGFNRLPKPLHREFDVRRLQVTRAFNLRLISVFGVTLKIFLGQLPSGRLLAGGFLADEGVSEHRLLSVLTIRLKMENSYLCGLSKFVHYINSLIHVKTGARLEVVSDLWLYRIARSILAGVLKGLRDV